VDQLFSVPTTHQQERAPPGTPASLDELIAEIRRLLPQIRSLNPSDLQMLARQLRILSNYAEGWAGRSQQIGQE
jgi:hypothetical protein